MLENASHEPLNLLLGTGVSANKDTRGLLPIIRAALDNGIIGYDTAPSYKTERILADCLLQECTDRKLPREKLYIQNKIDAWQMLKTKEDIFNLALDTIKKMGLDYLDAYLIHWPVPEYFEKTYEILVKLKEKGFVRYIGACNFRMRQLEKYKSAGYTFDIIQIERHPLRICLDEEKFCRENSIILQAYSPLCKMDERILKSDILNQLSNKYHKDIGQIILRWHLDTGYIPIFASKKTTRISQYANIFDFALSDDDVESINKLNIDYKMYLESVACPGF